MLSSVYCICQSRKSLLVPDTWKRDTLVNLNSTQPPIQPPTQVNSMSLAKKKTHVQKVILHNIWNTAEFLVIRIATELVSFAIAVYQELRPMKSGSSADTLVNRKSSQLPTQ